MNTQATAHETACRRKPKKQRSIESNSPIPADPVEEINSKVENILVDFVGQGSQPLGRLLTNWPMSS